MVCFYYDLTPDRRITSDPEGQLVQLCERCAATTRGIAWAGDGAAACELCDATDETDE